MVPSWPTEAIIFESGIGFTAQKGTTMEWPMRVIRQGSDCFGLFSQRMCGRSSNPLFHLFTAALHANELSGKLNAAGNVNCGLRSMMYALAFKNQKNSFAFATYCSHSSLSYEIWCSMCSWLLGDSKRMKSCSKSYVSPPAALASIKFRSQQVSTNNFHCFDCVR